MFSKGRFRLSVAAEKPLEVLPGVYLVRADNSSAMSFSGTNTWVVFNRSTYSCCIIDPAVSKQRHQSAIEQLCADQRIDPSVILLTHDHRDHAGGSNRLSKVWHIPCLGLRNGTLSQATLDSFLGKGFIRIIPLPGHSSDSVGYYLTGLRALFTGDVLFSEGWSFVGSEDSSIADYLDTLDRIEAMLEKGFVKVVLPGHLDLMNSERASIRIREYRQHRKDRLTKIKVLLERDGLVDSDAIVQKVYSDLPDERLRLFAKRSVEKQVKYLLS
ncbi:hypothetical protein JI75_06930 [Berryella intestinalis]|uniref:Metallo-beta-lactamase domain-containing protein n=2 Tax=Berryella intestinalis TaxID=1531429 RepID=A0A0A8B6G9_9ACTN|nr:hypothetical protein JI75_06930 [Berryella intestinalis]